jgi:glycosyltransferase involved in cell wall biosynthesis
MFFTSLDRYFERPADDLPMRSPRDYGKLLAGVIVKYAAELPRAAALGAPVYVVPNGVPIPSATSRTARDPLVIIGTAARISPQKKLEELIDAVRLAAPRLPPFVVRVAGRVERDQDEYADELRRRATGLPVEWLGEVTDVPAFLGAIDVFAAISEPAGCPNATLEAMAHARPIVATDFGGASEQIEDGATGRLVARGDAGAFADALVALAHDPHGAGELGRAARARAVERFDVARMIADYRRVCLP